MPAPAGNGDLHNRIRRVQRLQRQELRLTKQLTRCRAQLSLAIIELNLGAGLPPFPVEDTNQPELPS